MNRKWITDTLNIFQQNFDRDLSNENLTINTIVNLYNTGFPPEIAASVLEKQLYIRKLLTREDLKI